MASKKACIIIPARMSSSRFPNKPLINIDGKSMIRRVYEKCLESMADMVIVATEDKSIYNHVTEFGNCYLTPEFDNGTLRVCHTALSLDSDLFDYVINVQGDEPFIDVTFLNRFIDDLENINPGEILTGAESNRLLTHEKRINPNSVKFISSKDGYVAGFTRSPFFRNNEDMHKHIGIYGFCLSDIKTISSIETTPLAKRDSLEQIAWLENGFNIKYTVCYTKAISIDTPEDLELATSVFLSNN
jgi:3-deoxy-manno-octulosonate cytidylyltransferase (CMP-KDO synthetase)